MFHQNIRLPGVYVFNDGSNTQGMQGAPIFCTMTNMTILGMNDASDKALVFPKYKVIFYDAVDFTGTVTTIDNTNGTKCIYGSGTNFVSSCKVYYDGTEIPEIFSTDGN